MKLTYIILSVVAITKSLSIPFFSNRSLYTAIPTNNEAKCYISDVTNREPKEIREINNWLSNTAIRRSIDIKDTMDNTCGAIISLDSSGSYFQISNGVISKTDCGKSIICGSHTSTCKKAFACCCDDHTQLNYNRYDKYQLSLISSTSAGYDQTIKDCKVRYPKYIKCFKLEKLQLPTNMPTNTPTNASTSNNASSTQAITTTNLATGLTSVLYLYFIIIASCIHNMHLVLKG
jgi:hypothetical protein